MLSKRSQASLVLLSGGQDSTTCLAYALHHYERVEAIGFCYQQRHLVELEMAKQIADAAKVEFHIQDLSVLFQTTINSLTSHQMPIQTGSGQLPNTFVDGRNLMFLSFAAIYAKQRGISDIVSGVCQTDYSGYPDCRDAFIKALNQTLNLAMDYEFHLVTPLMWLTKAETILMMKDLGHLDWYSMTHTCYEGLRPACGKCPACLLRLKGFREAGISDLIEYV